MIILMGILRRAVSAIIIVPIMWYFAVYGTVTFWPTTEQYAVEYITENLDDFKDDFAQMGYTAKIVHTLREAWGEDFEYDRYAQKDEMLGYKKKGVLLLYNEQHMYAFDVGFDFYCGIKDDIGIYIKKRGKTNILGTSKIFIEYPIFISITEEPQSTYIRNAYTTDLESCDDIGLHGAERKFDKEIKKYFPKSELLQYINTGIDLQNKIVTLYENNK